MQLEADTLKRSIVGGALTTVVALGIGSAVSEAELNHIASAPQDRNVILVQDFSTLTDVEDKVRNTSCTGEWSHALT